MRITLQMKKALVVVAVALFACLCFAAVLPFGVGTASAMELNGDEYDTVFIENMNELSAEHYFGAVEIKAQKELLYDIELNTIGYVYDFTVNGEGGYAVVLNSFGIPEAAEFFFDAVNPYSSVAADAKRIYVSSMSYAYYNDGYYWTETDLAISDEILEELREIAYLSDGSDITSSEETIYYISKNENNYNMALRHPAYFGAPGLINACAPIAGTSLVQYFDRYYDNLISNYIPGGELMGAYLYYGKSADLDTVAKQLYIDMATNVTAPGTTVNEFKTGMNVYCNRQGYSVMFNSCMNNNKLNYELAKNYMNAGQPIVLFVDGYSVSVIFDDKHYQDDVSYLNGYLAHIMTGFGYKEITYTLNNGSVRTDKYIAVASGNELRVSGYYNINYNTTIDDAYGVNIM